MADLPRRGFDSTFALMRDPYRFIGRSCREAEADLFQTRILLRRTVCMVGRDAAELFYTSPHLQRRGAVPGRIQKTLFGRGGVQALDGKAHLHRKKLFMSIVTPVEVRRLSDLVAERWEARLSVWESQGDVELYQELRQILTEAVCAWAGVPLSEGEVDRRTRQLTALFDHAGDVGPKHWWARLMRKRANEWIEGCVQGVRAGDLSVPDERPLWKVSQFRDVTDQQLSLHDAAVEVLNLLRPTVAVAVYMVFVAHALHVHGASADLVDLNSQEESLHFVQEVRRYYPFFPAVVARITSGFDWNGYQLPEQGRVMLDLYGTNHDPRLWTKPDSFEPLRFQDAAPDPFRFIPQGGGDAKIHHRCPGEPIAIELMLLAVDMLRRRLQYQVPSQNLDVDYRRLPALPENGFRIRDVTRVT